MAATIREKFEANGGTGPSFDSIRLIAALLVLFDHCFLVTGGLRSMGEGIEGVGDFAVAVFFVISGYVNAESFRRDPCRRDFLIKRALRLYPALFLVVLVVSLLVGPIVTSLPPAEYFAQPGTWIYLVTAVFPLSQKLPGLFADAPSPFANGSLWTLRYEIICYLGLAFFGSFFLVRRNWFLLVTAILTVAPALLAGYIAHSPFGLGATINQALPLFSYFAAGACLSLFADRIREDARLIALGAVLVILGIYFNYFELIFPLAGGYLVIVLGNSSLLDLRRLKRFRFWGDFSYGTYIWAFPIQQLIFHYFGGQWWFNLAVGAPATLIVAMVSWHFVERPFLTMKARLTGQGDATLRAAIL